MHLRGERYCDSLWRRPIDMLRPTYRAVYNNLGTTHALIGWFINNNCDRITGDDCFIAKVYVRSANELESIIDRFMPLAQTNTSMIQSSPVKRRLPSLTDSSIFT